MTVMPRMTDYYGGLPVNAFSEMEEMHMKEHRGGHGPMMGPGHMEMMGDALDMCVEHADTMGLSETQLTKMKPLHREMQKNMSDIPLI